MPVGKNGKPFGGYCRAGNITAAPYPIGTTISLSNVYTAIVLENFEAVGLRPHVRVIQVDDKDADSDGAAFKASRYSPL